MFAAGSLKYPILIQAETTGQDAAGQPSSTWTTLFQTRADVRTATSREIYALGSGFTAQVTHTITIRYPAVAIKPGMQIILRDRVFLVQLAQDPDESRVKLQIMALEQNK